MHRAKLAEFTGEELEKYNKQLQGKMFDNREEWNLTKSISEVMSAVINQSVIDVLSPPETINSINQRALLFRKQRIRERDSEGALRFIESEDLEAYLQIVKKMGGSAANSKRIRKLTREYLKEGKHVYISQSACKVMTESEWIKFQAENTRKQSKTYRKGLVPQENNHVETIEIPQGSDRLAA